MERSEPTANGASLGELFLYLWRLARPEVWMVSFLPVYIGWVLATRELVPGLDLWASFWAMAASQGASTAVFLDTLGAWWPSAAPLLLGLVVMGPLLWTATLLVNDVHDLPGDRRNPRKAGSPLVQGLVTRGWARAVAYGFAIGSLVVAWLVSPTFLALTLACLGLAWAYSVPPLRLKEVPGGDLLVNAAGVGVLATLAGWSLARPLGAFPFAFLPQGLLVATAVYVPTTLVDLEPDRAAGYTTLATCLGARAAYLLGWWAWVLANAGALFLSWNGWIIPRRMLPILLAFVPLLLYQYHSLIGGASSPEERVQGIVLCSLTFLSVNLLFALMYTGLWTA